MRFFVRLLLLSSALLSGLNTYAQTDIIEDRPVDPESKKWFVTGQLGGTMAFGDDSWNVFKDIGPASAMCASLSVGYTFNPLISARLRGRLLRLHSRVNLEVYQAYHWDYPEQLPNKGFYGYSGYAVQAEAMFNVTNLVQRQNKFFNLYLLAGAGFNTMGVYDSVVKEWGTFDPDQNKWISKYENAPGLVYPVDTSSHTMPLGMVGFMLDFRITPIASLNLEAACTFTGDNMEGVKYEESYDAYITYSAGLTIHF